MESAETEGALRVLVLEDDPAVRRALSRALRGAGHEVVTVERCDVARGQRAPFDVAVLDLELPDGSGVDVAAELLGLGATRGIVFFSAAADRKLLGAAAVLGDVVAKSGDFRPLLAAVAASPSTRGIALRSERRASAIASRARG